MNERDYVAEGWGPDDMEDPHVCGVCNTPLPDKPAGEYMVKTGVKTWGPQNDAGDRYPVEFDYEPRPYWKCGLCGAETESNG